MFGGTRKSPSPASSNYDFTLRHERVKLFARVLKQYDSHVTRTVQAMREVAGSLSAVGQSYHEVAQCVNNTNPQSAMNRSYEVARTNNSPQVVQNYGKGLQGAATVFAGELQNVREGDHYVTFNKAVNQGVLTRLHEAMARAKKTSDLGDDVAAALRKLVVAEKTVRKKEAKYTRLGKPITESKLYAKQQDEMRKRQIAYETRLRAFDSEYEGLMQRQLYVTGHTMDDFLDANTVYLAQILRVMSCLAPQGAEAVAKMVAGTAVLGDRLGIAPEDQVASRLRPRPVNTAAAATPPGKTRAFATPVKDSVGRARSGSAHNFTSYYRNRKHRDASANEAPPTARALDDDSDNENDGRGERRLGRSGRGGGGGGGGCATDGGATTRWSTPGSPPRDRFSSYSPQRRGESVFEPDPTPPTPPPRCPNPMARFAPVNRQPARPSAAAAAAAAARPALRPAFAGMGARARASQPSATSPAVPKAAGAARPVIAAPAAAPPAKRAVPSPSPQPPRAAAAAAVVVPPAPPAASAAPAPAAAGNAAHDAIRAWSASVSPVRAPFGDGATPAFQHDTAAANGPATTLSGGRSPSAVVSSQCARPPAQQAQAAVGVGKARSTEPYDDDDDCNAKGVVSYSARGGLRPVNLLAAMDDAAADEKPSKRNRPTQKPQPQQPQQQQQRHVNPLAPMGLNEAPWQQQQQQQQYPLKPPRRSGTKPKADSHNVTPRTSTGTTAAPAAYYGYSCVSAPPPPDDETLSSSTHSRFLADSNANSLQGSLALPSQQQQQPGVYYNNAVHNANAHLYAPAQAAYAPARAKADSDRDAWETETGGVSGRSNALSASYALDSPAMAPHGRAAEAQGWEDGQLRRCSAA